jgi:hypothetical protein
LHGMLKHGGVWAAVAHQQDAMDITHMVYCGPGIPAGQEG